VYADVQAAVAEQPQETQPHQIQARILKKIACLISMEKIPTAAQQIL
jgi:hypothetical protein